MEGSISTEESRNLFWRISKSHNEIKHKYVYWRIKIKIEGVVLNGRNKTKS
jgi:hypothetical protein